jgi:hypothetical protein
MGATAVQGFLDQRPSSLIADRGGIVTCIPFDAVDNGPRALDQALIDLVYKLSI